MAIADRIHEHVQRLPEPLQAEVLSFVEYLLYKARCDREEDVDDWSTLSLLLAMRGMEGEEDPIYTTDDLKETFS